MNELSLHILDVIENSTRAGARLIEITIIEATDRDKLMIEIRDDGSGMDEETLGRIMDPFYTTRTVRRVGLGIPLLAQAARAAEGSCAVQSSPGGGTRVTVEFRLHHIDRQPLGKMDETLATAIAGNPEVDFVYTHRIDDENYRLDTRELRLVLDDVPLNSASVIAFIRNDIAEALAEMKKRSRTGTEC
jgi:hypothetical protein